ncbi:regulator of G protein signaling superfamily, partial [Eremomyces bilateralis CBS 781.70]
MSSSRPLTVAIPRSFNANGPFCARRPNLSEILANTAPPPWTLSAFMAYLSQNHCLETLEFTMDASRYRKHYSKLAGRYANLHDPTATEDCQYVKMLWQRLMDAYIASNGHREVNLPGEVRDELLSLAPPSRPEALPPHPSSLDPAVDKVYELMSESVLVPFLNSVCPQSAHPAIQESNEYGDCKDGSLTRALTRSYDERAIHRHPHAHRSSPP